MKAISRQQRLFRSSPPCQPPFAPLQECGRVCVCVCDRPLLLLERPARSWCQPLLHQNAGTTSSARALTRLCPPVCLPDWRVPIGDTAVQLPVGQMKSLFDSSLDWLGSLPSLSRLLVIRINLIKHLYSSVWWCTNIVLWWGNGVGVGGVHSVIKLKHSHLFLGENVRILLPLSSQLGKSYQMSTLFEDKLFFFLKEIKFCPVWIPEPDNSF